MIKKVFIFVIAVFVLNCTSNGADNSEAGNGQVVAVTIGTPSTFSIAAGTQLGQNAVQGAWNEYQFTTGAQSISHTISLTGVAVDIAWDLSTTLGDRFQSNWIGGCDQNFFAGDESCTTPVLNANTTYYLIVTNYDLVAGNLHNMFLRYSVSEFTGIDMRFSFFLAYA